jgi:hypothetical protein
MRLAKSIVTAVLIGSTALAFSPPAISAPLLNQAGIGKAAPNLTENVRFRGRGGFHHGGFGGRHYGYRGYRHGGGAAALGGLAAGALIGGAIAAGNANAAVRSNDAYCFQRYQSYDPASGTYLGYDGDRHPCP